MVMSARCTARLFVAMLVATQSSHALRAAEPGAGATPQAQNVFDINEFRVLGNRVLAPVVIERAVYPLLGPARTIDSVKQAADALEKAYRNAGYGTVYVDIPEQKIDDGIVRLKVTEGRVERVHVHGARYFSDRQILSELPALQVGQAPRLPDLQSELTALNARTEDRAVTPVLKAGTEPGTVDVNLAVADKLPLHGSLETDDRHTADTTPNRVTASLSYDNLWQRQDTIGVQYQTAPAKPSDARVLSGSYLGHVGSDGALVALSYIHTSSDVLALGTLGVLGSGSIYGAHLVEPLWTTAQSVQSLDVGIDFKNVSTEVLPDATSGSGSGAVTAPVKYLNWSAVYSSSWRRTGQAYSLTAGVGLGVRGVVNYSQEFENARYAATPDYLYLRLGASASETLPGGFAMLERVSSQWADGPLVNNEQFSLGGVSTVRGYLEAEALGDSGGAGTLELHTPPLGSRGGSFLQPLYGFVFVDAGVATILNPLPAQRENVALWSDGLGFRLENPQGFTGSLDYAVARRDGVRTRKGDSRLEFSLLYGF
jgi:hemolysin activation/secretion protein